MSSFIIAITLEYITNRIKCYVMDELLVIIYYKYLESLELNVQRRQEHY